MIKGFIWDKGNIEKNAVKHRVSCQECEEVFFDENVLTFKDETHSQKEERYVAYGQTNEKRKLTIIFTIRFDLIRVISARDMNRKERKIYEQNKKT